MRYLFILLMVCSCLCSYGQTVSGIVTDKRTRQPVTGAWVTSSKATAISGIQGEFTINTAKSDTVKVKMQGYKLYGLPVNPSAKKNLQIVLEEAIIELNVVHVTAKRDRVKDSLNNRKMFAKEFNAAPPKLKDIIVVSSNPGPIPIAGVTIIPSQFIKALTYKHSREYKFKQVLIRDEQARYIDSRFSERLVTELTGLKGDSLLDFMDKYRPGIEKVKTMSDYDIRAYINISAPKFRSSFVSKAK
ncbi:MAG: CarboxypepD reg-like protein [Mucilaginibacter sp.]|nr:CarboxypepD reg-like protein [Mucilaginibacter sp.]